MTFINFDFDGGFMKQSMLELENKCGLCGAGGILNYFCFVFDTTYLI